MKKESGTRYTRQERDALRSALAARQQVIKEQKLPVIVMVDGWSAAGKGSAISSTIRLMDPRFFKVYNMDKITEDEWRRPFLYRYAVKMPGQGQVAFFDGSYLDEAVKDYLSGLTNRKEFERTLKSIRDYERSMTDNGYQIIKIFLNVDKKTQKKRLKALQESKNTAWRVVDEDLWQNENYETFATAYQEARTATETSDCPWHVVEVGNEKDMEGDLLSIITHAIDGRLAEIGEKGRDRRPVKNPFALTKIKPLAKVKLEGKAVPEAEYRKELEQLQKKLSKLHYKLYRKKIPMVIAYEGWDAAGKGGNIKRVASALDCRGYEVFPIASPTPEEKSRHFLWRFWNRLPKTGHIAIFDRTWYGRVMVERLEGYCSENDWQRAYNEINEFERDLTDAGTILVKFWVQIDKDTQLQRFTERQNTPEKQWKITDEDWRNREKWDLYETAMDEMLQKTNTEFAPWTILESNDKYYARIKALKVIIGAIEEKLKEKTKE